MDKYQFYKNTLSVLDLINKGGYGFLIEEGWIPEKEMDNIIGVMKKLDYVTGDANKQYTVSDKGQETLISLRSNNESNLLDAIIHAIPITQEQDNAPKIVPNC